MNWQKPTLIPNQSMRAVFECRTTFVAFPEFRVFSNPRIPFAGFPSIAQMSRYRAVNAQRARSSGLPSPSATAPSTAAVQAHRASVAFLSCHFDETSQSASIARFSTVECGFDAASFDGFLPLCKTGTGTPGHTSAPRHRSLGLLRSLRRRCFIQGK